MAGAGYKLFNTGDVLTAAQVNTYLMEQSVMVFDDAAARTTALSGVVSEGMLSYLKDTNAVEVYDGSSWVASDDPNAIQNTIVDAKGDLIAASADNVPARLAVGNNGETLVADSSATTGLRYQGNFAAGKNKVINGDFYINQRGFSSQTTNGYGFDRFPMYRNGGTSTYSAQTFTPGSAPVAGYEGANFARIDVTGQTDPAHYSQFLQGIENVRTLAGQTATISFWAKAASGTPKIAFEIDQNFGSGGSPSTSVKTYVNQVTLSTSWTRYSMTFTVPSITGKTLGTTANTNALYLIFWLSAGSDLNARTGSLGLQTNTFDIWGVQLEAGSVATAFQTATGTLAGELAACQRYYQRITNDGGNAYSFLTNYGMATTTGKARINYPFKVSMRIAPSTLDYSTLAITNDDGNVYAVSTATLDNTTTSNIASIAANTASTIVQYRPYFIGANNSASAYIGFSAEL